MPSTKFIGYFAAALVLTACAASSGNDNTGGHGGETEPSGGNGGADSQNQGGTGGNDDAGIGGESQAGAGGDSADGEGGAQNMGGQGHGGKAGGSAGSAGSMGGQSGGGQAGGAGQAGGSAGGMAGMNTAGSGVGDPKSKNWVYLMLGQSNMSGMADCQAQDIVAPERVFKLSRNKTWVPGHESYNINPYADAAAPPCSIGSKNLGPSRAFAVNLLAEVSDPEVQIYIINMAASGSSVEQWDPQTGTFFAPMIPYLEAGMAKGVVRGLIWHQGEANSGTEPASYAMKLGKVIQAIRDKVNNPQLPVVAGEVGTTSSDGRVNRALGMMATSDPQFGVATSENLSLIDNVHYDAASQREFGRRYAKVWWALVNK